jgi:hypothetical protein
MKTLCVDQQLTLEHVPSIGAWAFHMKIPNISKMKQVKTTMKVTGLVDNHPIDSLDLSFIDDFSMKVSFTSHIRTVIGKASGRTVNALFFLRTGQMFHEYSEVINSFKSTHVFNHFNALASINKVMVLEDILSKTTEQAQSQRLVHYIQQFKYAE